MTKSLKSQLKGWAIGALDRTHLPCLAAGRHAGACAIFALHRVKPYQPSDFEPNRNLEITPAFLDQTIRQVRDLGFEIVSLDEAYGRLRSGNSDRRFVCFTLDDGYVDNYQYAAPVFQANQAPFTIYMTTGFVDGTAHFWWMLLEDVIRREASVALRINGTVRRRPTKTITEKYRAFHEFHRLFRMASAESCRSAADDLCTRFHVDPARLCADHSMTWDMARRLTKQGLGRIEAHMIDHIALSRLTAEEICDETDRSIARILEKTGRAPQHFAYPFGDSAAAGRREYKIVDGLPFLTATTTKSGLLPLGDVTCFSALPRLTLNGLYQTSGYVNLILSNLAGLRSLQRLGERIITPNTARRRDPGIFKEWWA